MGDKNWKKLFDSSWKRDGILFIQFLLDAGLDLNTLNKFGKTMLSYAAASGNLTIAECLVQKGADVNVVNSNGSKPLHIAALYGQQDMLKFCINGGISVNSCDDDKWTALHYIAAKRNISSADMEGYQEIVRILVDCEADLNAVNQEGCTPLILSAQNSHKELVGLFIELGANLECCDENQWTVLHYASKKGWTGIIVQMLKLTEKSFDLDAKTAEGYTPVVIAAQYSHADIFKLLIEIGVEVFKCRGWGGMAVLNYAAESGWLNEVKYLVRKGCDLNSTDETGMTPSLGAVFWQHEDVVEYLIECGADVKCCSDQGETLLHICPSRLASVDLVEFLVSKGCDLNATDIWGNTPLLEALGKRRSDIAEYLIEFECESDVRAHSRNGRTALHYAGCEGRSMKVVESLVRRGCDLNAQDSTGQTPLMRAVAWPSGAGWNLEIVQYLIECAGVDVESCDKDGLTVLHHACLKGSFEVVKSLIKKGSNIDARTVSHDTPLHLAIRGNHVETIKHLLNAGADFDVVNGDGKTAFNEYLRLSPSVEVIILFLRRGAYFQTDDYAIVSDNSLLKEGILQNTQLCSVALINKFNNADLPKIYGIHSVFGTLPHIEELKIGSPRVVQEIEESVKHEIQTMGFCNLLNVCPIVLRKLCVSTLLKHCNS